MNIENILDKAIEIFKEYDYTEDMKILVYDTALEKSVHIRFGIGEQEDNLSDKDSRNDMDGPWNHDIWKRKNIFIMVSKKIDKS
jgi:hypothetical protein